MTNNDILRNSPLYLLDIEDTLFDKSSKTLKLDSYHNYLKSLDDIPGINTSFIYVVAAATPCLHCILKTTCFLAYIFCRLDRLKYG